MNIQDIKNEILKLDNQIIELDIQLKKHREENKMLEIKEPAPFRLRKLHEKYIGMRTTYQNNLDNFYINNYDRKRSIVEALYKQIRTKNEIINLLELIKNDIEVKSLIEQSPINKINDEFIRITYSHNRGFYDPIVYEYDGCKAYENIKYNINPNFNNSIYFMVVVEKKNILKNLENEIKNIEKEIKNDKKTFIENFSILKNDEVYNGLFKPFRKGIINLYLR